ncbi:hypothetical protein J4558_11485 [Leptolyngbya sp. 15MV]|nr:hypothetical protein J4558_11485 [Leptolyngbya sp. 15MV]
MNRSTRFLTASAVVAALGAPLAASASPVNISFTRINPANAPVNPASQFNALVNQVSGTQVSFRFTNTAVIASSVSEIYYDSRGTSPLLTLVTPLIQSGANFVGGGANPGNLPGGQNLSVPFQAVAGFSADATGNPSNGLDVATDFVEMRFNLATGRTYADLLNALANGDLRLGLHVRAIQGPNGGDWSDSFVNNPYVIPLPPAAATGLAMLGVLAIRRLRAR